MERRLTEAVIPALRTKKAQEEVYHTGTPSAGIRVTRDGAKTFFIRYRSPIYMRKDAEPLAGALASGATPASMGTTRLEPPRQVGTSPTLRRS